jgi:hypothetical protein
MPRDVVMLAQAFERDKSHELAEIAQKLMRNTPDQVVMWRTLEKYRVGKDDLWVWQFLQAAADASTLPAFHLLPQKDRRQLSDKIASLANRLASTLKGQGLDAHLLCVRNVDLRGYYVLEDFSKLSQRDFLATDTPRIRFADLLNKIARWSQERIDHEPLPGNISRNARAVRFIRLSGARHRRLYGKPLEAVIATAANALFETTYISDDVRKLLSRLPRKLRENFLATLSVTS